MIAVGIVWILAISYTTADDVTCTDTDDEATGDWGLGCSDWDLQDLDAEDWCENVDDDDFISTEMCCTCGGGETSVTCTDTDDEATDVYGDGCSSYDTWWCEYFDDDDFFSREMCCTCGGGKKNDWEYGVWQEKTDLESGKTCSLDERYTQFAATLDECKAEAINQGYSYIYFQDTSIRAVELCHIYTSCENTRDPSLGGTNYEYVGNEIICSAWPTSPIYDCTTDGDSALDWTALDREMDSSETSACEELCIGQGEDGCCWVDDTWGCFWKSGAGVSREGDGFYGVAIWGYGLTVKCIVAA